MNDLRAGDADLEVNQPLRRGVVAVIVDGDALLVIRRALGIAAPGAICFPGGGIESQEDEPQALVRELTEELGVVVQPSRLLWRSVTDWRVSLAWWHARLSRQEALRPNPAEVAEVHWWTVGELLSCPDLLSSNREFLSRVLRGEITLDPGR